VARQASANKAYLVVGASGTIGSAVARRLAAQGVSIGLHYCHNQTTVKELQASLENAGARCVCIQSNLDSENACAQMLGQANAELGTLNGVALCGGRVPWKAWQEVSAQDWQSVLFEHCVVPFTLTRMVVPQMQERGEGCIVYLSSIAAKYGGSPRSFHYAAAKGALEAAMHGLSRDIAKTGVRINGIRSGFVHSPQQQAGRSPKEIAERIQKIPMCRSGKPEEVAAAIAFLLSAEASFITGEIVTVAGGD
jgi:NAD(P)-dependent dehydrogenase (short-subunit alcohol dehydrogenase family)